MKCIEARRMVTPFVKKELSDADTEAFLRHVESCSDCMDELDIYYTAYNAINLLDSGTHHGYDFGKMLAEDIRTSKRSIFRRKVSRAFRFALVVLAELLLILSIISGIGMKRGLISETIFQRALLRIHIEQGGPDAPDER